jgi:hypothetical protein
MPAPIVQRIIRGTDLRAVWRLSPWRESEPRHFSLLAVGLVGNDAYLVAALGQAARHQESGGYMAAAFKGRE